MTDIGGLVVNLGAAGTYVFEAYLGTNINTGTAGAQFGVQYTGTVTGVQALAVGSNTGVAPVTTRITAKYTAGAVMLPTAAEGQVIMHGMIIVSTAGNFSIQALKVTSQTLTIRAGSHVNIIKVA